MSQPDLFVVCKNCGSEVSPYVTECPYCGQRVRKRAPKLDRSGQPAAPKRKRRTRRLSRLRPDEIAGIAPDTRPYATFALILVSIAGSLLYEANKTLDLGYIVMPGLDEVWRWFASPFLHQGLLGYQFVALIAVGIFGTLLERRYGMLPVVVTFILAGAAGSALAVTAETAPLFDDSLTYQVIGANGAALGLLCAWLVEDRMAARRGDERENDLMGVYVIGLVLLLLSLAVKQANIGAAAGGAIAGALIGLALPLLPRKTVY
ncbi:MAG TPA: rhomboid family intramembrane serine protease [Thermoleophilaceae bacterium]